MNDKLRIIIACLVLLLSTSVVFAHGECEKMSAQNGPMKMTRGNEKGCIFHMETDRIVKHAKEIGLSKEQIAKINDLKTNYKKDVIKKQAEIDTLKIDKQALVKKDDVDLAELKKIIQKMAVLEGEKEYNCMEACVKVKKVLNDEQRKKLREMMKMRKDGGEKHKKQKKHKSK
ncbi:MAG: Spy/CpxP family protein refolding chaperone [bacterium]